MRMKLRDVRTGSTFDTSYRPEEKFEQAIIETVPASITSTSSPTDTAGFSRLDTLILFFSKNFYCTFQINVAIAVRILVKIVLMIVFS